MSKNNMKYIGVQKINKQTGKRELRYRVHFQHEHKVYQFGNYTDAKECAKAYDLFVIKSSIDRPTNFFKKKLV